MAVRHQNMGDRLALEDVFQAVEMLCHIRAGIDYGDIAMADNVDAGPDIGERAGIVCDHTADERRDLLDHAIFEINLFYVGYAHKWLFLSLFFCRRRSTRIFLRCEGRVKGAGHPAGRL